MCLILINKFQCMDPLSTYLPNFSCHFLPLWKIFQFKCAAAQLNLVHPQSKFPIIRFNFPFLICIFFAKFAASCPVWAVVAQQSSASLMIKRSWVWILASFYLFFLSVSITSVTLNRWRCNNADFPLKDTWVFTLGWAKLKCSCNFKLMGPLIVTYLED